MDIYVQPNASKDEGNGYAYEKYEVAYHHATQYRSGGR